MENCANTLCPYKQTNVNANKPTWFTVELLEMIKEKDVAFFEAHKSDNPNDLQHAKKLRTDVKRAIRNARAEFIKNKLTDVADNPRKFWLEINKLIKHKTESNKIELADDNGTAIPEIETADHINRFFSSIGSNLASNFTNTTISNTRSIDASLPALEFNEINENDLYNEIQKIKIFKSSSISGLTSRIVKDAMLAMFSEFKFLRNTSLQTGKVPINWKIATVTPIPKVKQPHQCLRYKTDIITSLTRQNPRKIYTQ